MIRCCLTYLGAGRTCLAPGKNVEKVNGIYLNDFRADLKNDIGWRDWIV